MSKASAQGAGRQRDRRPPAALLFAALGDESRLGLLDRLAEQGPASITRLAEGAPITRQAVSKHLRVLATAGLVSGQREGREHRWQIEPDRLRDARAYLERVSRHWDDAIGRLREFVED